MDIIVSPRDLFQDIVTEHRPHLIVSLLDPHMRFPSSPEYPDARHLKVPLHDITQDQAGWIAPHMGHVQAIVAHLRKWERMSGPLYVHCYAGISRSTATAYAAACLHNPDTSEQVIAEALRAASPVAQPNRRLIRLLDQAMKRQGRMIAAIESIGPGTPPEGGELNVPFGLPGSFT